MNILITICARGGSKGIPGKNIKDLGGKPLIAYTIDVAHRFALGKNAVVALSTDSGEISSIAEKWGLSSNYKRAEKLATDTSGKIDAIADLMEFEESQRGVKFEYVLDMDVTSPLRTVEDMEAALDLLVKDEHALNIFSVNPANRNPYFNMVEQQTDGYYKLCKTGQFLSRQTAPAVYDMNASFYIYRRSFFELGLRGAITERSLIYPMQHICFDLDHMIDFEFMQFLIENNKLGISI